MEQAQERRFVLLDYFMERARYIQNEMDKMKREIAEMQRVRDELSKSYTKKSETETSYNGTIGVR